MAKSDLSADDWTTCESKSYGSSELNAKNSIAKCCNTIILEKFQCGNSKISDNATQKVPLIKPPAKTKLNMKKIIQKEKDITCLKNSVPLPECDENKKQVLELNETTTPDTFSFGYPVGITWGSLNRFDLYKGNDDNYLGIAIAYIAFGYLYMIPEKLWTTKILDNILLDGKKLYDESKSIKNLEDINDIKTEFFTKNYNIKIKISNKIIIGKLDTNNKKVINVNKGLNIYFRIYKKCLFMCNNIILLIWKKYNFYYIYDSLGRNNKLILHDKDKQLLLCFRKLINVYNFIVHMCNLNKDSVYTLYNITMKSLSKKKTVKSDVTINNYKIVNNNYAILLSNFNINNVCFVETKNKQSLAACFIAIVYSKIIPPSTWNSNVIDKIIIIGDQLYSKYLNNNDCFLIDNLPIKFTVEKYIIEVFVNKNLFEGKLNLIINYNNNDLNIALCKFFINNQYCLIQINNLTYAIWEYNNFYYLFNLYKNNNKTSIEIYNKLTNLCYKLYNNIMKITCYYNFMIHSMDILTIKIVTDSKINVIYDHKNCINNLLNDMNIMNESIDDIFLKRICAKCKEVNKHNDDNQDQVVYNLDSPNLSETQFIPPWYMIKNDIYDVHKDGENLQDVFTHKIEDKKLSEEEKALQDYENVLKELEKNNNDKRNDGGAGASGGGGGTASSGATGGNGATGNNGNNQGAAGGGNASNKNGSGKSGDANGKKAGANKGNVNDNNEIHNDNIDNDKIKNDKIKNDKIKNDKIDNDKINNDKNNNDKNNNDKINNDKNNNDKINNDQVDNDEIDDDIEGADGKKSAGAKRGKSGKGGSKNGNKSGGGEDGSYDSADDSADDSDYNIKDKSGKYIGRNNDEDDLSSCGSSSFNTNYPGLSSTPYKMAVVGSVTGSYKSLNKLLNAAFKKSDRCLIMTTWNQYIVFVLNDYYYFYDGCTCNIPGFRRLDLTKGTCGLCPIKDMDSLINKIMAKKPIQKQQKCICTGDKTSNGKKEDICSDDKCINNISDNNILNKNNLLNIKNQKSSSQENKHFTNRNSITVNSLAECKENVNKVCDFATAPLQLTTKKNNNCNANKPIIKCNIENLNTSNYDTPKCICSPPMCKPICATNTNCSKFQNNVRPLDLFRDIIQNCIN